MNDFYDRISKETNIKIKPSTTLKEWEEKAWLVEAKKFV